MTKPTKQVRKPQPLPQRAERRIVRVANKLARWAVQGATAGAAREVIQYALDLWTQM
ncbi:hypothetical protein [Streptomyces sp. NPDC059071]|uniref:hypothetical protein n=1 Tax=unclassified Streptomyces TaxID=2593676 RepID=UPI003663A51E